MLSYKKFKLSAENITIDSAAYILTMETDTDSSVVLFAKLVFNDGASAVYEFVNSSASVVRCLIRLTELDIPRLKDAELAIQAVSAGGVQTSNSVPVKASLVKIRQTLKSIEDKKYAEVIQEVARLRKIIEAHNAGYAINLIQPRNTSYIKPGMVPVAIEGGEWIAAYPFVDVIVNINDKTAVDGKVVLTADDINYTETTTGEVMSLSTVFEDISKVIVAQAELLKILVQQSKADRAALTDLAIKFEKYTNTGLI